MQFSRLAATFLFVLTFGVFALATPTTLKRETSIEAVLDTLKTTITPTLAAINATASTGTASSTTLDPLFTALTNALDTAGAALADIDPSTITKRADEDAIAELVAGLLTDIATTVDQVLDVDGVAALLPGLDTSLNEVLKGLETLLAGVLNLVAQLLVDVAGLLRKLALGLTLASLGL